MARRARHCLRKHSPGRIENAGRDVAGFARGRAEAGAHKRLRLLLDDGDQTIPHDLEVDLREGRILHVQLRVSTMWPRALMRAV